MAETVVDHRGSEFNRILREVEERLRPLFGSAGPALLFAGSGTGAMEAAAVNCVGPGDQVLVVDSGSFGRRFAMICEAIGAEVTALTFEWGQAVAPARIAAELERAPYKAVFVVHNESSTGVAVDLAAIGAIVAPSPALLIVDSVSGLGAMPVRQDQWGLDVVVTGSQKALMCPPGLALACVSEKAWRLIDGRNRIASFYWDFRKARASFESGDGTPFTSAVSNVFGLHEALTMIHDEGLDNVLIRHRLVNRGLRTGAEALGLKSFPDADAGPSASVVVLETPDGLDASLLVRRLYEDFGTVVAGERTRLKGKVIRIGTMGWCGHRDILTDLQHIGDCLAQMGYEADTEAALAAAKAVFDGAEDGRGDR